MKKSLIAIAAVLTLVASIADASTWYVGGVLYGNICRSGVYYTVYPIANGQPVGSICPIRNDYGQIIGTGFVSNE